MAKGTRAKHKISEEPVLFGLALPFLKENNGISKADFPDKFIEYLRKNKFLREDDEKLRGTLKMSRENEIAIEVAVRNLYSSHKRLFRTGQIQEKAGKFHFVGGQANNRPQDMDDSPEARDSSMENVIYYGPPGTGKTYLAKRENPTATITLIQFHSSYTYEHFVQGERLVSIGDQRTTQIVDGPLMICYRRATNTPVRTKVCSRTIESEKEIEIIFPTGLLSRYEIKDENDLLVSFDLNDDDAFISPESMFGTSVKFKKDKLPKDFKVKSGDFIEVEFKSEDWVNQTPQLLIIDEINRADSARVFGELMTALADIDDHGNDKPIMLQYSGEEFRWPDNLRLIGTMNSADRSIGEIDQAMKRRFKIINCPPRPELLKTEILKKIEDQFKKIAHQITLAELSKKAKGPITLTSATCDAVITFFNQITTKKACRLPLPSKSLKNLHDVLYEHESSIFAIKRKLIGHSFHMEIAQVIAEKLAKAAGDGQLTDDGLSDTYAEELAKLYWDFVDQEIKPQIASICLENDAMIDDIFDAWKKRDSELTAEVPQVVRDKASNE